MAEFLSTPLFRYLLFPLISIVVGVWIKYSSRNDRYAKFRKEDLGVGLDIIRQAIAMYVLIGIDRAAALTSTNSRVADLVRANAQDPQIPQLLETTMRLSSQLANAYIDIPVMIISLSCVSTIVRKLGWKSETELTGFGIALPLVVGFLSLFYVMVRITS